MSAPLLAGRYSLHDPIASGGMATVHFGRLVGEVGFSRTVAIKRVHQKHGGSKAAVEALVDEARLASRIQHPNVVPTLDVFVSEGEIFVVMEFVMGETLARLIGAARARSEPAPPSIVAAIGVGILHGLHAAHEAASAFGKPLEIVHRDVSPQNIIVGVDGLARVLDFGIATASERLSSTRDGQIKGKVRYMAPEQMRGERATRRTDVFAAGIVMWEALVGRRVFETERDVLTAFVRGAQPPAARELRADVPEALSRAIQRAMALPPEDRFGDAMSFAIAVEDAGEIASPRRIGEWVTTLARDSMRERARMIARFEREGETPVLDARAIEDDKETQSDAVALESDTGTTEPLVRREAVDAPAGEATELSTRMDSTLLRPRLSHVEGGTPRSARLGTVAGTVLVATFVGGAAAAIFLTERPTVESPPPPAPTAAPVAPAAPATARAETTEPSPPPTSTVPEAASAPPSAPPARAVAPRPQLAPPRTPTADSPPPVKPAPNCNPPYVTDANGIQRFKPECL